MKKITRNKHTEYQFNANIDSSQNFAAYLESYKRSFDILIEDLIENKNSVDTISQPLLFLARHCMELGFKTNINYFSKYSKRDEFTAGNSHNLENLFSGFKMHIEHTIKELKSDDNIIVSQDDIQEFEKLCQEVENLNKIFHQLDKSSTAFRYPFDKNGEPSIPRGTKIDLIEVQELLERSMILFRHTSDVFSKYTDYKDQIENYFENMMIKNYQYS